MHRVVFIWIFFLIIMLGSCADAQDNLNARSDLIKSIEELKDANLDATERNTKYVADSYSLLASAEGLTNGWTEFGRAIIDVTNMVVTNLVDAYDFFKDGGAREVITNPSKLEQIMNGLSDGKDFIMAVETMFALNDLLDIESYKMFFQTVDEVEKKALNEYKKDKDNAAAYNVALNELRKPSASNGLIIPLKSPRLSDEDYQNRHWASGTDEVKAEIDKIYSELIRDIPDPLPADYPYDEIVQYINELKTGVKKVDNQIISYRIVRDGKIKNKHVALGMVKADQDKSSFIYNSWMDNQKIQFDSTLIETGEILYAITKYATISTDKTGLPTLPAGDAEKIVLRGITDTYDGLDIAQLHIELKQIKSKPADPLDALQYHLVEMNCDLVHETSNLWTLSKETERYLKNTWTKKEYPLNISVLNSAGLPAGGAAVILDTNTTYTTDSQGKLAVILPDGNHTINASKPGYGIGNWSKNLNHTQTTSINITLHPVAKHPFVITTVNSANFSIGGAEVMVDGVSRGPTGPDGTIRIELTDDNHTIVADKADYGSGNWSGRLDHSKMIGVVVTLNGALEYPFNVTATNAAGYNMEGANVSVDGIMKGATDRTGEIRVFITEGEHVIDANKTDYGSGSWSGVLNYSQFHEVAVRLNGALEYPFNVTVVNAANYTTEGAAVSVSGVKKGVTDRHGHIKAWLVEGNQTISAVKVGYGSGNWTGNLSHDNASGVVVRLNGPLEYPLNITVVNPANYTVPGADIIIDGRPEGFADNNGVFMAMLSDANHTIEVNKTGYLPGKWTGFFNHTQRNELVIPLTGSSTMMDLKPVDLCLVLDTSGSMSDPECADTSKIEAVKKAAEDTIAGFFYPGTTNRIAVVSFSDVTSTTSEFTNNYSEAYSNVSQLYAWGATSFGLGLSQAVYEFSRTNRTDHVPVILFMSDGMHNTLPDYGYYIARCMLMGIRVYTVGYGSEADHDLLKEMATLSGGEYLFADPCGDENSQIQNAFIRLQMNLSGWRNVMNISGEVIQNQTANATGIIVSSGSPYMIVNVVYPGSHLKVSLIGPDGKLVDPEDYVYNEDRRVISIRKKDPVPGNYTVQVHGDQVDGIEPYTIYISSEYVAPTIPSISSQSVIVKEISGETLVDYPVRISVSGKNFPSKAEANGTDVNIFDQNGRDLPRWIESWDARAKKAEIWAKIPEIPANGEVRLTILAGNPGEPARNNGRDVFDFFDDFDSSSIDGSAWTTSSSGNATTEQHNGLLHIRTAAKSVSAVDVASTNTFSSPVAVRFRANVSAGQNNDWKVLGLGVSNANHGLAQPNSSVCFNAVGSNLFSYHSLTGKNKRYPVLLAYPVQNITWGIRWLATGIEFSPSGNSRPHELSEQANESIPLRFGINATMAARASEITLDWVSAWRCASKEPVARVE